MQAVEPFTMQVRGVTADGSQAARLEHATNACVGDAPAADRLTVH